MKGFILDESYDELRGFLASATKEVFMVAPFISERALAYLKSKINSKVKVHLVTKNSLLDIVTGYTSMDAVLKFVEDEKLEKRDISIYLLSKLHAKLIIVDDNKIFFGSSNFTDAALGGSAKGNKELNYITEITPEKSEELKEQFMGVKTSKRLLEKIKHEADKERVHLQKQFSSERNSDLRKILEDLRKREKGYHGKTTAINPRLDYITRKLEVKPNEKVGKLKGVQYVYPIVDKHIKVIEAKQVEWFEGKDTFNFQITGKALEYVVANKIDYTLHVLKDEDGNYDEDVYFLVPSRLLKCFIKVDQKGTPHYYINHFKGKGWYMSSQFRRLKTKKGNNIHLNYNIDKYQNLSLDEIGKTKVTFGRENFMFDEKHDKKGKETMKHIDEIKNIKTL